MSNLSQNSYLLLPSSSSFLLFESVAVFLGLAQDCYKIKVQSVIEIVFSFLCLHVDV